MNIKLALPPTNIDWDVNRQPFNGDWITLICPLYGTPELDYTWNIPINHQQYPGMNSEKLNQLIFTRDRENNGTILSQLRYFKFRPACPTGLFVNYYDYHNIDGDYYCTGRNSFGSQTALVANVNNGSVCLSPQNFAFYKAGELIIELQREYKVTAGEIGGDVNLTCKVLPFASHLRVGWMRASDEGDVEDVGGLCEGSGGLQTLSPDTKYNTRYTQHKCTKVSSLIIHNFDESDIGKYVCVAQLCLESAARNLAKKSTEVSSDTDTQVEMEWVFSLTAVPVLTIIATSVVLGILIYVNKLRLIRWYIAWRREEPSGDFEYNVFLCIPEEYDGELIGQLRDEILYQMGEVRVLWQENEDCDLIGLNHYVRALEVMKKCKKFIFIVNERFEHCFFCKQMVDLVTEKSRVKNWNIILPIKWTDTTIVPRDLMVYRYVEREKGMEYLREIDSFLKGRPVINRNRKSTINYPQVLFSKSYNRASIQQSFLLINT